MKGPFSVWPFFGLTIWIDALTHLFSRKKMPKVDSYNPVKQVTVLIPAHKEAKHIEKTINHVYKERYPIKNVIVCGDYFSQKTKSVVDGLTSKYSNLMYIECPHASKAMKINFVTSTVKDVGDFIYVRDARVIGKSDCIEKMMACFSDKGVAAVTSYGRVSIPKNMLSRAYHYGKAWINEIGRFRKNAQEKREAVFVICGASTIYRTNVLRKFPIPALSKTEDTHYTWVLQKLGYRIRIADDAVASAPDIDGKGLSGILNQVKQSYRWSIGTMQCLVFEGGNSLKNKKLFFSTIIPGFLESITYSIALLLSPFFLFYTPKLVIGFLIGDTLFSIIGTLIIMPRKFLKTIIHYPEIVFYKYLNALIFMYAMTIVSLHAIIGNPKAWRNEWIPPQTSILKD